MRRRGVPADEVTMNSIIDGLVSCSPPRVREAETLLTLMTGWGLKPNQVLNLPYETMQLKSGISTVVFSLVRPVVLYHWCVPATCFNGNGDARPFSL